MGCQLGKPKDGMTGEKVSIWDEAGVWHQKGVDGKTYMIYSFKPWGCNIYQELSQSLQPNQRTGRIMQYGQMRYRFHLFEVKEMQKKVRQLAEENGIEITYECFEYSAQGNGMNMNRT